MQPVELKNLSFSYETAPLALLDEINLSFSVGWTAVAGINGSGKSTLLKLIAKELTPQSGLITGNDLVSFCVQSTEEAPVALETFMTTYTTKAFKIRDLLGVEHYDTQSWDHLSHGERKRLQLAVALYQEPDLLIVDEPTNHLDHKSKEIVLKALKSFKGVGIIVSHDRALLDVLVHTTVLLKDAKAIVYHTNYTTAMKEQAQEQSSLQIRQKLQETQAKQLHTRIQTQKERVSQSKKRLSKRDIGKHDSDAREKINAAKLTGRDRNDTQLLKRIQNSLTTLQSETVRADKQTAGSISFEHQHLPKAFPWVIEATKLSLGETRRLQLPRLSIEAGSRIGIEGENGTGKSTLMEYMTDHADFKDKIFYLPQELTQLQIDKLIAEVNALTKEEKGVLLSIAKRLLLDPKSLIERAALSAGEVRKLLIAQGLLKKPAMICLDEPTNHLDIHAIEALEEALKNYHGALAVISHDRYFLDAVTDTSWMIERASPEALTLSIKQRA